MAGIVDNGSRGLNPLIAVKDNAQLDAEAEAQAAAMAPTQPEIVVSEIARYIKLRFQDAERHKTQFITPRLLDCQRRVQGKYSEDKLAQIQAAGGCDTYFNNTETKKSSLAAWIQDTIAPVQDKPWALEPTPIPDIPESRHSNVVDTVRHEFLKTGAEPTPDAVFELTNRIREDMLKQMLDEARERIEGMERKIEDQLAEGDFNAVVDDFIDDLCAYPTAFIKGPEVQVRKQLGWSEDGKQVVIKDEILLVSSAPSPFDVYPAPNARDIQEGDLCILSNYDVMALMAMKTQPGWNAAAIDEVLKEIGSSSTDITDVFLFGQSERARAENRDPMINGGLASTTLRALDFWGAVPNKALRDWGMTDIQGQDWEFAQINGLMIGRHVVYCIKNPDPLGTKPISATSFKKVKGSVWGQALPEVMADCQDPYCACLRNLVDNLAFCAGPMLAVDVDALPADYVVTVVEARQVLQYNGSKLPQTGSRKPYEFFQPNANADTLLEVADYFDTKADDRTQIPKYVHGNENVGGAGQTASGMSMLMTAAAKGVKRVLGNIDRDIFGTLIRRYYVWNMLHDEDLSIKGDAKIVPRGVMAMLIREQTQLRRQEFLDKTANDTDMSIIGIEGRATLLRKVAEGLDMPVDKIVPPPEVLKQKLLQMQQEAAAQAAEAAVQQAPPQKAAA